MGDGTEVDVVDEVAGVARLAGALVDTLTGPIQETHQGIAGRVFGALGPIGTPARLVHDVVAGTTYGAVRGGGRLVGAAAGAALALPARGRDRRPLSGHPLGAQALAFGSGLLGDWMDGRTDDLVVRATCTQHGRVLPTQPAALVAELDDPTDRLVLLVHGLAETTAAWAWWSEDDAGAPIATYAERLCAEGWTPLEVGYNTGLPVERSGAELATLVEALVAVWPVPLAEIALVGHSMGGLVAGAACHAGATSADDTHTSGGDLRWTDLVSHVVTLGTPHAGSWLARGAHALSAAAGRRPETRGLAAFLDLRSPGIRDLTRGWRSEPELLPALLPHARHAFVTAGLGRPWDRIVGDGLVHARSGDAPARAVRATTAEGGAPDAPNVVVRHHPGVGHLRLLHHPAVADDLVAWLGPRRAVTDGSRVERAPGAGSTV